MRKLSAILLLAFLTFGMPRAAQAQVTVAPFLTSNPQFLDGSGSPLNTGCVFTYAAGTTTPLVTYSDSAGSTPNSNPVILNSGGFPQAGGIWLTSAAYKFVVKSNGGTNCSTGSTITTTDGITWATAAQTFAGIVSTGDVTLQQGTAATNGANHSSNNLKVQGTFWNGSASATESCNLQDVLGTGANPTVAFTLTCSGSSGATTFSVVPNTAFSGSVSIAGQSSLTSLLASNGLSILKEKRDCTVPAPLGDGLVADGTTNDRVALNNCLANAYTNGQAVQMPSGRIHVSGGAVNDTNKPGMPISGVGSNLDFSTVTTGQDFGTGVTQIMCDTGAVCWDATGSGEQKLNNFGLRIANTYSTPSTFGFLFGRDNATSNGSSTGAGTYCFSENDVLNNVWVYADSLPAATAVGRVGIYNMGAEAFTMYQGGIVADLPGMFGTSNVLGLSSPFQTLSTGCPASMTEVNIQAARFQAITKQALRFDDQIASLHIDPSTEILNNLHGTNHNSAFFFNASGNQREVFLSPQVEEFDNPITIAGNMDHLFVDIAVSDAVGGMLIMTGNNNTLNTGRLNFVILFGTAQPLINASTGTGEAIKGFTIFENSLTGSGAAASTVTLTGSDLVAPGLTSAATDTFATGSAYKFCNDSGCGYLGGIWRTPGNVSRVTSDFTSANSAALQAITGLSFSLPAVAVNYAFHCAVRFSQATNVAGDQFGIASLTTAPTLLSVDDARVAQTVGAGATIANGVLDGFSTTTPTAFVTFTPGITGQLGATFDGVVEASGSGASALQFYVLNGTAADVIVVKKDSYCTLYAQ